MGLLFYLWSKTAASNSTADAQVNWAEGQAPSSVNDSARAMMASLAGYRDDMNGSITTGGTSSAYTVTTNQVFDTLAHMTGQTLCFSAHITNVDSPTLNVDGLGAKPIRSSTGVSITAGTLITGSPYRATYFNSTGEWVLEGFYGNPYNVPIAGGMDYWGPTVPNSNFAFPIGQAISRTTYSSLFSGNPWSIGTTYGAGDGSTTFNLPDKTGRASAMKEASATRLTSSWFGGNSTTLGAVGGNEKNALSNINQVPQFTPAGTISNGAITFPASNISSGSGGGNSITTGGFSSTGSLTVHLNAQQATSTFTGTAAGSASPSSFTTTPPTIICNYIIRII